MAKINNQAVLQKLIDELRLYPAKDSIPTELAEKVLPVFQINSDEVVVKIPTANIVKEGTSAGGGTVALYTTPATGKFYLTNVSISARDSTTSAENQGTATIDVTIDGTTVSILILQFVRHDTHGSPAGAITYNLQNPVLIDQGTAINLIHADAEATISATMVGYTESD